MDPQPNINLTNNKNQHVNQTHTKQQLNPDKIISMMRITKKTDPLFKPLKKLKNALESIGYDKISLKPRRTIILFHFGLGNQLDLQFIKNTKISQDIIKNNPILPGKSYCFLTFPSQAQSQKYCKQNFLPIIQQIPIGYTQIQFEKLSRILIVIYINQSKIQKQQQILNIQNTSLHYKSHDIPGIYLIQQFLTKQEQNKLFTQIQKNEWIKLNNRRVQHYGYQFKYGKNKIDKQQIYQIAMPQFIIPILNKLKQLNIIPNYKFDQMTINDYFSGDGIPSHFDTHSPFQQYFVAISILSGIVMDWRKYDGVQKSVYLPARSLIIFSGQGRYAWTHGISCRKIDKIQNQLKYRSRRISITLRKIKYDPCMCQYYFYCDSQGYDQNTMKKNNPLLTKYIAENINNKKLQNKSKQQIYKKYVLQAYNGFGFDFHNKSIVGVQKILNQLFQKLSIIKQGQQTNTITILDVGCGNGQYKQVINKIQQNKQYNIYYQYIGIQICQTMKPFQQKIYMDGLSLTFRQSIFDIVLSIAVIHHMTNQQQRYKMIQQLYKVIRYQGYVIITVFGYQQKIDIYKQQDILLDYCVPQYKRKQESKNIEKQIMQEKNIEKDSRKEKRGQVYQRYYHLFKREEIRNIILKVGFQIQKQETDKQNIILLARKERKIKA